ncbi:hypothetical protein D3C79_760310 [compost metagenome]
MLPAPSAPKAWLNWACTTAAARVALPMPSLSAPSKAGKLSSTLTTPSSPAPGSRLTLGTSSSITTSRLALVLSPSLSVSATLKLSVRAVSLAG